MAPKRRQLGGTLSTLVILAAIGVIGYYAWKTLMGDDSPPSCAAQNQSCLTICNKTATEAPAMKACQEDCQTRLAACTGK